MNRFITRGIALVLTLVCCLQLAITDSNSGAENDLVWSKNSNPLFLKDVPHNLSTLIRCSN